MSNYSYPKKEVKWALAKAIVREFPCLRDDKTAAGCVSLVNNIKVFKKTFKTTFNVYIQIKIYFYLNRSTSTIYHQEKDSSSTDFGIVERNYYLSKRSTEPQNQILR